MCAGPAKSRAGGILFVLIFWYFCIKTKVPKKNIENFDIIIFSGLIFPDTNHYFLLIRRKVFAIPLREAVGGKPARPKADVPLLQKSDRRKLLLQLCEHTAFGCGLGTGR